MEESLEIEAAFDVPDGRTGRLLRDLREVAGLQLGPDRIRVLRDTYLDTRRQALRRAGWALRRREEGGRITLELKSLDPPREAIRRRRELAAELVGLEPPDRWPAGELRSVVDGIRGEEPLAPLFVVRQRRRTRPVRRGEVEVAELCLDTGRVTASGRTGSFRVLEVEALPAAGAGDLEAIAAAVRSRFDLAPTPASKYERGMAMAKRRARRSGGKRTRAPLILSARGELDTEGFLAGLRDLGFDARVASRAERNVALAPNLNARLDEARVRLCGLGMPAMAVRVQSWLFQPAIEDAAPARTLTVSIERPTGDRTGARYLASLLEQRLPLEIRDEHPDVLAMRLTGLAAADPPIPARLRPVAQDTAAEAGAKVVRAQAWRMRAGLPGLRRASDPEFVHLMRVACRRARFALRLFAGAVGADRTRHLRAELAWIAVLLGEVRDHDVFDQRLAGELVRSDATERFARLLRTALAGRRAAALARLHDALASPRFLGLLDGLERFEADPAPGSAEAVPATRFAREAVARAARKLTAAVRRLGSLDAAGLHRLRILVKRLRYTAEFFEPLGGRRIAPLVAACVRFQRTLGASQDAAVGERMLRSLLTERLDLAGDVEFPLALGALMQVQREELARVRRRFPKLWASRGGPIRKAGT